MKYTIILVVILLFTCNKLENNEDLSSNLSKWNRKNIDNYEFTLIIGCFCPQERSGPHMIKVVNDEIVSVNNQPYDPSATGELMTIDELFTYVVKSIKGHPYKQSVEYNPTYGYPQSVYFDFNKEMVDEEIGFQVTDFKH